MGRNLRRDAVPSRQSGPRTDERDHDIWHGTRSSTRISDAFQGRNRSSPKKMIELTDEMKAIRDFLNYYVKSKYPDFAAYVPETLFTDIAIQLGKELEDRRSGTVI